MLYHSISRQWWNYHNRQLETDFYATLLEQANEDKIVYIEDLIPVEWDKMRVFPTYADGKGKVKYAGYEYAKYLTTHHQEGQLSLLFFKEGKVVYYADWVEPSRFDVIQCKEEVVIRSRMCWVCQALCKNVYWPLANADSWCLNNQLGLEFCFGERPYLTIQLKEETIEGKLVQYAVITIDK